MSVLCGLALLFRDATVWLQALLFDLDGTLADTEAEGHRPAYNSAFKDLGLKWKWGPRLYRKLLNLPGGRERVRHYVESYDPERGDQSVDELVDAVHTAKSRHYARRLAKGKIPLRPGVRRLIEQAKSLGLKVAIVTNASHASIEPFLSHAMGPDLVNKVDLVIGSEEAPAKKPAPDLYLMALERLGVAAERSIAIEDSDVGLQAARAAGLTTLVTVNSNTRSQAFDQAVLVVDSLGEADRPVEVLNSLGRDVGCHVIDVPFLNRLIEPESDA